MHSPIGPFLAQWPVFVVDGALATELERRGADLADALWSAKCLLERPELIRAVHLDYFKAGADVATTATYQASFEAFGRRGIGSDDAARLMRGQTDAPLIAYPNSGECYDPGPKRWSGAQSGRPFGEWADAWHQAGARLIGGCCRTTPQDIHAIGALRAQSSEKCGSRFSKNARTPSTQS